MSGRNIKLIKYDKMRKIPISDGWIVRSKQFAKGGRKLYDFKRQSFWLFKDSKVKLVFFHLN